MIKPLGSNVLLYPTPKPDRTAGGILLPQQAAWLTDCWEYTVGAVGPKVSADVKPGMRCLLDPTLLSQKDFDLPGVGMVKLVPESDIQLLIGVANE